MGKDDRPPTAAEELRQVTREAHEAQAALRATIAEARELMAAGIEREVDARVKREVDRQLAGLSRRVKQSLAQRGIDP